jgi:hypothetical protein
MVGEQIGGIVSTVADVLRTSPGLLVLVLLQVATLGLLFYVNENQSGRRQAREMFLLEHCVSMKERL